MDTRIHTARNEIFNELRPRCVELSHLALQDDGKVAASKALIEPASQIYAILDQKCRRTDGAFDAKLANYVFFPLSQILQRRQKYTDRLSELTIKCITILLEYGWRTTIELDLAKQLLILLTFVAGGVPGKAAPPVPEELVTEAFAALAALFHDLSATPGGGRALIDSGVLPALGHCVVVVLDGVTNGASAEAQQQALRTLGAAWAAIKDPETLAGFLPGTVSALTKSLVPGTAMRRARKTMILALDVFQQVLASTLSDIRTRDIKNADRLSSDVSSPSGEQKTLTPAWLKATAGQIKLALSNIVRLRNHESVEVRTALNNLCLIIVDECHDTLSESSPMLVETCMALAGIEEEGSLRTTLGDLASIHADIGEHVKTTVYNWITSLPRVLESNDDTLKQTTLDQLSRAQTLLTGLNLESSILQDALQNSLRDSITVMLESSPAKQKLEEAGFDINSQAALTLGSENALVTQFQSVVLAAQSQRPVRKKFLSLLGNIGTRDLQISMASEMLEYARRASGPSLLSAYWLSFHLLQSATASHTDLDEFFESALTFSDEQELVNQDLFSYSLSVLTDSEEMSDWRVQAIALEVMADTAQRLKEDFRAELIDTLYPITQFLGSPVGRLREHAIVCLNIISKSCGYKNASELIVDNVDYMVNSISLRLNTFDISPQAPQVLVMIIRLTGPSLLPYLDDVVSSIFAALDNFHGYQLLVDTLFSVLGEIVSVGSNSGQLSITNSSTPPSHQKTAPEPVSVDEILDILSQKQKSLEPLDHEDYPRKPWKSAKELLDEADASADPPEEAEPDEQPSEEIAPSPPTKTYTMLRSITQLSQHFLTSSSPRLRSKLLHLISTSSAALAFSEDGFLPLVNDIWPVVVRRLYDLEPYVQTAAAETVSALCRAAGDFLATRVRDEWAALLSLARMARASAERESSKRAGGRGVYSQAAKVWEAVAGLLVSVVGFVRIDDQMFDDVLAMLERLLESRRDVRAALEVYNADAVWLALRAQGRGGGSGELRTPIVEGYHFVALEAPTVG